MSTDDIDNRTQFERFRDRCFADGFTAAVNGEGILDNPHTYKTPESNFWIDGWCAFHSTDNKTNRERARR